MNIFQAITEYVKRDYSTFDMKNNWIGSVNGFGSLNAIYHSIVLPSDTWKLGHNVLIKLPPLVAPAFTRIKAIVNSYYCSFASVWNYWNSFISDKPEDVFLSRSLTQSYKGKFVEPCVSMRWIAFICKIAKGYFAAASSGTTPAGRDFNVDYSVSGQVTISVGTTNFKPGLSTPLFPSTTIVWSVDYLGRRKATLTNNWTPGQPYYNFDYSVNTDFTYSLPNSTFYEDLGFADLQSYFIFQCQEVERNLSNHGVPTDMLARTDITFYHEMFNLLPFIAESSIWHNFYRDEQNQSPEFDYREINGSLTGFNPNSTDSSTFGMPYGWHLRLLGIPPNGSTGSDYWFRCSSYEDSFSVLTGFMLEEHVRAYVLSGTSTSNITILPKFYNGLLVLKYRNFEKDYFTSACVDPNFGGVSVQVPSTIEALRTASKLEEFLEVSASARDFYNFMKHVFGTNPESTRYQKPLLLGTQVIPIQISEQLQTSQTTTGVTGSPLGERAGVADGFGNSGSVNHYFNEHGLLVSYLSFVLDSQYMQGMPHEFFHHLQLDYPFPQFANLGAESIPLREIYYGQGEVKGVSYQTGDNNAVVDNANDVTSQVDTESLSGVSGVPAGLGVAYEDVFNTYTGANVSMVQILDTHPSNVFGYTPRYSKWKFKQDIVAGQMRDSMEFWHTFRHFSERPYISNNFVSYMNAGFLSNLNRIFAVVNDNADKFYIDAFNNGSVRRCLPLVPQTTMD